jgi:hypothetical protein
VGQLRGAGAGLPRHEGEGERREGGDKEEVYSERAGGTQAPEAVVPRGLGRLFRVGSEEGQIFKSRYCTKQFLQISAELLP